MKILVTVHGCHVKLYIFGFRRNGNEAEILSTFGPLLIHSGDHTETIQLEFDPTQTDYETLLTIFWNNHDSTACTSRQYMSAIFYHSGEQKALAEKTKEKHQTTLKRTIQTRIKEADTFYDAEE